MGFGFFFFSYGFRRIYILLYYFIFKNKNTTNAVCKASVCRVFNFNISTYIVADCVHAIAVVVVVVGGGGANKRIFHFRRHFKDRKFIWRK